MGRTFCVACFTFYLFSSPCWSVLVRALPITIYFQFRIEQLIAHPPEGYRQRPNRKESIDEINTTLVVLSFSADTISTGDGALACWDIRTYIYSILICAIVFYDFQTFVGQPESDTNRELLCGLCVDIGLNPRSGEGKDELGRQTSVYC